MCRVSNAAEIDAPPICRCSARRAAQIVKCKVIVPVGKVDRQNLLIPQDDVYHLARVPDTVLISSIIPHINNKMKKAKYIHVLWDGV